LLSWWAVDGVALHGRVVSVAYDCCGADRYGFRGLQVFVDGERRAATAGKGPLVVQLL